MAFGELPRSLPYSLKDDSHYRGCMAEPAAPRKRSCLKPAAGYLTGCYFGVSLICVNALGIDALECLLGS